LQRGQGKSPLAIESINDRYCGSPRRDAVARNATSHIAPRNRRCYSAKKSRLRSATASQSLRTQFFTTGTVSSGREPREKLLRGAQEQKARRALWLIHDPQRRHLPGRQIKTTLRSDERLRLHFRERSLRKCEFMWSHQNNKELMHGARQCAKTSFQTYFGSPLVHWASLFWIYRLYDGSIGSPAASRKFS
jgi:hypothetical protein